MELGSPAQSGSIGKSGLHTIDLARLVVGDITKVHANLATRVNKPHGEGKDYFPANDSATLTVQFAIGATGTIFLSYAAHLGDVEQEQRVILYDENGTLEVRTESSRYVVHGIMNHEEEFHDIQIPADFRGGSNRDDPLFNQLGTVLFS